MVLGQEGKREEHRSEEASGLEGIEEGRHQEPFDQGDTVEEHRLTWASVLEASSDQVVASWA